MPRPPLFCALLAVTTACAALTDIDEPSSRAALYDLTVSAGTLEPAFDPDVLEYHLRLGVSQPSLAVAPVASSDGAAISIGGTTISGGHDVSLPIGTSVIDVAVASGRDERRYAITVVRGALLAEDGAATSAGAAGDRLGTTVAFDGDRMILGAPGIVAADDGPAARGTIYSIDGTGALSVDAQVTAPERQPGDEFGAAIAIVGDLLLVGAPGTDGSPTGAVLRDAGAVHVFARSTTGWTFSATLHAGDRTAGARFGAALAAAARDGRDEVVVGAPGATAGGLAAGAAYVLVHSDGVWREEIALRAGNPRGGELAGTAVALERDAVAVGAPGRGSGGSTGAGAVYVFTRSGGAWVEQPLLGAGAPRPDAAFGAALATGPGSLVVGAPGEGAVYVYGGIAQSTFRERHSGDAGDAFGSSLAIDGDLLVVGAPGTGDAGGAAVVFGRQGHAWSRATRLAPREPRAAARFGAGVAVSGLSIAIGAPGRAPAPGVPTLAGSVHVFR
jgi:hypothetical protein